METTKRKSQPVHPRAKANPLSALTFGWTLPIFWGGLKKEMEEHDLYEPLEEHASGPLGDKFARLWEEEVASAAGKRTPSLLRVILRAYAARCMLYGFVLLFMECGIRIAQPVFLGKLVEYYSPDQKTVKPREAYLYAGAVVLCSALNVFFVHPYMMAILHMGMKFRVACCSLIYRKSLRLSKTALGETTVGQVVNLLSNDVNRFDVAIIFLHYLWIGPLATIIVTYFMWLEISWAAVVGVGFMLAFIPLQAYLGKRTSVLRLKTALRTDERVRLMNEILSGIQVIKMYTWEKPFADLVVKARKQEIKEIRATSYIRGVLTSFIMFTTRICLFFSILAFVLVNNVISAKQVFVVTSFYNILRQTMTVFFPQGIAQVAEATISIKRLQSFMLYEDTSKPVPGLAEIQTSTKKGKELIVTPRESVLSTEAADIKEGTKPILEPETFLKNEDNAKGNGKSGAPLESGEEDDEELATKVEEDARGVRLKHATAKWIVSHSENTLTDMSLTIKPGKVNEEEDHPRSEMVSLDRQNISDPLMYSGNFTDALLENAKFKSGLTRYQCIYIYSGMVVALVVISLLRSFMFFSMAMRASTRLHNNMFASITRAPMRFFHTNPSGRILNRFSKDMGAVDEVLPSALLDVLQIGLSLIGIVVVVGVVNYWLLLPTVAIGLVFYGLRIFYLASSRSIKRLEGVTRSPVFSHLNASLQGITTIRAFGAQEALIREFDNHQDLHSSAWYLFIASSRAFGFWLDLVCVVYIAVVTLSFLVFGNEEYGGNVGLAITQAMGLTGMFQWGMRQSTELENQMTSVERIQEYSNIESEPPLESEPKKKPPPSWPEAGKLEFKHVYLFYAPGEPAVLKDLSMEILPKEKVGIVGRTGAGKSSLINALFRLAQIEGEIIIDGRETSTLGLHELRSQVSIIPQEPVLFSGTMRHNLDPFDEYPDQVLWRALEEVELKEAVMELPAGLSSRMSEGGGNFSVGQRQLVCLARAIVRRNRLLVLDEATANVDPQTDALIQTTIRNKFADCTVLTIAHRLHTVMDSDKVLVMDAGQMVEFDHPHMLLKKEGGILRGMVDQTGRAMAETLARVAMQAITVLTYWHYVAYNKKHSKDAEETEKLVL
ncbi:jg12822 [Pararge aegeria aegeria]|uniref:Jg12822 protein n=1 Tax=Pararge aegeria aegeria TaxID=348720 RepID=A0A8S4RKY6_9NEOP|nr:jg12822 [Pararge aegeria aegeria]